MMSNVIAIVAMGLMGIVMLNKGTLASTRRMALVPFAVCLVEIMTFGLLHVMLFPVLSLLLWATRCCMLVCCGLKLRQDGMVARRRARRRALEEKRRQFAARDNECVITTLPYCA